jgi:hypothetical protein
MKVKSHIFHLFIKFRYTVLVFYCLVFFDYGDIYCQSKGQLSFLENCSNYILISGESNINQFSFTYNSANEKDTKIGVYPEDSGFFEISIPIRDFEASNPLMYNDFLKIMKATEYPRIKISLSRHQLELANTGADPLCPVIAITIAGTTRAYRINCNINNCLDKIYINGSKKIRFSDFNLSPPKKLNGLVKVQDEININFGLIVNFSNQKPTLTSL